MQIASVTSVDEMNTFLETNCVDFVPNDLLKIHCKFQKPKSNRKLIFKGNRPNIRISHLV